MNKGHPREKQNMVFIDKWSLFGGYFVLFYKRKGLLKCGLYLQGGIYSEVTINTGLTVFTKQETLSKETELKITYSV